MGVKGESYKMATKKRAFSEEFRRNAVRLVLAGKKSRAQIARELGVRADQLFRWQKALAPQSALDREPLNLSHEQRRIQQLEQEVETLKEERDILKKATAFFAKNQF